MSGVSAASVGRTVFSKTISDSEGFSKTISDSVGFSVSKFSSETNSEGFSVSKFSSETNSEGFSVSKFSSETNSEGFLVGLLSISSPTEAVSSFFPVPSIDLSSGAEAGGTWASSSASERPDVLPSFFASGET